MNVDDKRAQICGISFVPIGLVVVNDLPGKNTIRVSGNWVEIPISSGIFKEKIISGEFVEQELKAVITDTSNDLSASLRALSQSEGLFRLKFTNGADKIVGTDQFPVLFTFEESGSPASFTLSFKRNSPELSKFLKSF